MGFPIFAIVALLIISCFFLGLISIPVMIVVKKKLKNKDGNQDDIEKEVETQNSKKHSSSDEGETLLIKIPKKFFQIERKDNEIIIKPKEDEKKVNFGFNNKFLGQVYTKQDKTADEENNIGGFRRNAFLGQSYRKKKVPLEEILEGYFCETCTFEEGKPKVFPNKDHCTQHLLKEHL